MYNEDEVEDSLEFCRNIQIYYEADRHSPFYDYTKVEHRRRDIFKETEYAYQTLDSIVKDQAQEQAGPWVLLFKDLLSIVICVVLAFGAAYFITNVVAHHTRVEGSSMEPTLAEGDYLIIEKLSYYFSEPKRYDIVVFPVAYDIEMTGTYYIKRVIGLPGETVQIQNGKVYINGDMLGEEYGMADILDEGAAKDEITLGEDEYFVLGDNRNWSKDSRSGDIGNIKREDIVGKACFRFYPFNRMGNIDADDK